VLPNPPKLCSRKGKVMKIKDFKPVDKSGKKVSDEVKKCLDPLLQSIKNQCNGLPTCNVKIKELKVAFKRCPPTYTIKRFHYDCVKAGKNISSH